MKKVFLYVLAASLAFAASTSCSKETPLPEEPVTTEEPGQPAEPAQDDAVLVPYTISVSQAETKTYVGGTDGKEIIWEAGDKLGVIDDKNATVHEFTIAEGEGSTSAKFEGELNEGATTLYVVYPFDASATVSGGSITATLPAAQQVSANGTNKGALVAVGTGTVGDAITLKNAFGLVAVTVKQDGVTSIEINGTDIAGTASFNATTGAASVTSGEGTITLTPADATFEKDKTYYIAALPGTTAEGDFSIEMVRKVDDASSLDANSTYTFTNKLTIPQNAGLTLSTDNARFSWTYHIKTKDQLFAWNNYSANWTASDKVYIEADIDMKEKAWEPHDFWGTLSGKKGTDERYKIYNFVTTTDNDNTGLFAQLYGTVQDLIIGETGDNSLIGYSSSSENWVSVGSVCGRMKSGAKIDNVTNNAKIEISAVGTTKGSRIGGIAGFTEADKATEISNCINNGELKNSATTGAMDGVIGGILGSADIATTITDCTNNGNITNNNDHVSWIGGIIGVTNGAFNTDTKSTELTRVYNNGDITATAGPNALSIGGIVGLITGGTLTDCENKSAGTISASHTTATIYIGGVAGNATSENTISLTRCNNRANLTTDNTKVVRFAGLIGHITVVESANALEFSDCHNYGTISNTSTSTADEHRVGGLISTVVASGTVSSRVVTLASCTNEAAVSSTKPGGFAAYVAGICAEAETPVSLSAVANNGTVSASHTSGGKTLNVGGLCGYAPAKITITSCSNTKKIYASGTGTINLGGFIGNCVGSGSAITGTSSSKSVNSGEVEGVSTNGVVTMGGIAGSSTTLAFSWTENRGTIHGKNSNTNNEIQVGGILGAEPNGTISLTDVSNSGKIYAEGTGKATNVAGGISVARNATFTRVSNSGEIYAASTNGAARIGGLVGWGNGFTINGGCENTASANVYTTRAVDSNIGGFVGVASTTFTIVGTSGNEIVNNGTVYGNGEALMKVGGILGWNNSNGAGNIKYAVNNGTVSTTHNAGQNMVGGIVGYLQSAAVTIENCTNNGTISDKMTSAKTQYRCIGGIVGRGQGSSGKVVTVKNNLNTGTIQANLNTDNQLANCGGIVGDINTYCSVSGNTNGVSGDTSKGIVSCTNDIAATKTTRTAYAGGIVGGDNEGSTNGAGNNSVTGNTNYAPISATVTNGATTIGAGGIIGTIRRTGTFTNNNNYGSITSGTGATAGGPGAVLGYMEATTVTGVTATVSKSITVGGVAFDNGWNTATGSYDTAYAAWLCPNSTNITATLVE